MIKKTIPLALFLGFASICSAMDRPDKKHRIENDENGTRAALVTNSAELEKDLQLLVGTLGRVISNVGAQKELMRDLVMSSQKAPAAAPAQVAPEKCPTCPSLLAKCQQAMGTAGQVIELLKQEQAKTAELTKQLEELKRGK